jgi:hypothetical protein
MRLAHQAQRRISSAHTGDGGGQWSVAREHAAKRARSGFNVVGTDQCCHGPLISTVMLLRAVGNAGYQATGAHYHFYLVILKLFPLAPYLHITHYTLHTAHTRHSSNLFAG